MTEFHYKVIIGIIILIAGFIRLYFEHAYKRVVHIKTYHSTREVLFVWIVGACFTLPGIIYLFTPWLDFAAFQILPLIRTLASLVMLLNILFFGWIHFSLGNNWSPVLQIRKEQELITTGPYKFIRHPMYTCIFVHALMILLVSSNWLLGLAGLISFGVIYPFRVKTEEKMMLDTFGDQYTDYMKRTGRLLPKLF